MTAGSWCCWIEVTGAMVVAGAAAVVTGSAASNPGGDAVRKAAPAADGGPVNMRVCCACCVCS